MIIPVADSYITFKANIVFAKKVSKVSMLKGFKHSEETKKKISELRKGIPSGMKGKHHTEESKKKISESTKGKHYYWLGKPRSTETREKISESRRNLRREWMPKEHKEKLRLINLGNIYNLGKHLTEETKEKIGAANLGRRHTEEAKEKMHHPLSEEAKKRISLSNIGKTRNLGEKNANWKGGISFEPYCYKFNERLKERIRERDNRTCQLCGLKENGRKLSVHHIHYDKENCDPDLISLCNICNIKANNNRGYWEDFFMELLSKKGLLI